jgi:precorrin-4/cobalt-precorrin-4 C11-methyltransferase
MTVYFVGAGPGDPELITVKGQKLLEHADLVIFAGSLVNPEVLARAKGQIVDSFGLSLEQITDLIVRASCEGRTVVRLHSGDPTIYSAIREQILALKPYGIECQIVPGVSSVFASAAALGKQLTSETLVITRPSGKTLATDQLVELSDLNPTMAVLLGIDKIEDIMKRVHYPPETPVSVVYHASWDDQVIISGTVSDIARKVREAEIARSAIILIGEQLESERDRRSYLYSPKT